MKLNNNQWLILILSTLLALPALDTAAQITLKQLPDKHPSLVKDAADQSELISTALLGEIASSVNYSGKKWAISVRPTFSRKHTKGAIGSLKASKWDQKIASYTGLPEHSKMTVLATKGNNFIGNSLVNGTPADNSMAISNGGIIVSANNDGVEYYNQSGTLLYSDFWSDFINNSSLNSIIYDPKVIYDSQNDRFIIVVLHGTSSSTSKILVAFSKTNNPQNGWWLYALNGNPLNNNCWLDYPNIGVSNEELFITGNLFSNAGSFNQSIIYQIPKQAGYTGTTLNSTYWNNINNTPYTAFSLVPAPYGHQGNYGPGMLFVSNHQSSGNKIRLYHITNTINNNPVMNTYQASTTAYSAPADAQQKGSSDRLSSGDCRIQNAFYLDGIIHFVFHSDIENGWGGINYNRLKIDNLENQSGTFGLSGSFDYVYPAVVSFSKGVSNKTVLISFLRSSAAIYPQVAFVTCDDNWQWSSSQVIKEGENYVNIVSGNERWGDYNGIARKHNSSTPRVWMSGSYGADIPNKNAYNRYRTWISEAYTNEAVSINTPSSEENNYNIFPIPSYDLVNIHFNTTSKEEITIQLFDIKGRLIKLIYKDSPKVGNNKVAFNKGALAPGTYFLKIKSAQKILKNEKIIILN